MNKFCLLFLVLIVLTGCTESDGMKVSDFNEDEYENKSVELSENFINAYISKDIKVMEKLASDRMSFSEDGIDMKSEDPNMVVGTLQYLGTNLEYAYVSSFVENGSRYYTYQLNEVESIGELDEFKIRLKIIDHNGYLKIDDLMLVLE